ncbi:hypothetical protein [Blastococcus brunescens]|uniref:Uncharacterized protein n=1 Tax=Blastococcus brunescens TaxID=1564165 RepID=A0ABZ1B295_9ACTN|nr:hypothetical protein [Blastococcus sp. BMG 8361]WRL63469.1 hypothetical protein U6N30_27740 [Blastococcus sp. BMG 8361]
MVEPTNGSAASPGEAARPGTADGTAGAEDVGSPIPSRGVDPAADERPPR